jgi:hypothetical protein
MSKNVRLAWIAVGGTFTVFVMGLVALAVWLGIDWPGDSAPYSLISSRTTETSVQLYQLNTNQVIVDTPPQVEVKVIKNGTADRLSVRRDLVWSEYGRPGFTEEWNGRRLQARINCPRPSQVAKATCQADYILTVPATTQVIVLSALD